MTDTSDDDQSMANADNNHEKENELEEGVDNSRLRQRSPNQVVESRQHQRQRITLFTPIDRPFFSGLFLKIFASKKRFPLFFLVNTKINTICSITLLSSLNVSSDGMLLSVITILTVISKDPTILTEVIPFLNFFGVLRLQFIRNAIILL